MKFSEFKSVVNTLSREAYWYHFEGRIPDVLHQCIAYLKKDWPSIRISLELENPTRTGLLESLPYADVLFFSKSWAEAQNYDQVCTRWLCLVRQTALGLTRCWLLLML